MAANHDIRLFELLEEAASWPEEERPARAVEACATGDVSPAELLAALARAERLDGFLEGPAWESADLYSKGDVVGRYRIEERLGEGGMGEVFLAEQEEPARRVALKLVHAALVTTELLDRFRAEQQALARLNHPHVAALYDAGVTSGGQPYFAMEWVDGQPIDRFFEAKTQDLKGRLTVFLDVCSAVRHAHQKQIVHRDLKPGNVLVREVDGRPVAKVIDFGIAEALDRPVEEALATDSCHVYGTPEYLSPESFDGDVDTRADVYALGILLYELLSGVRPFRRAEGTRDDLLRRILQGDAEPPSVAAGREDEGSGLAFSSPAARRRWTRRLEGDLDAVVRKAMHRDRDQRYDTVADLASDVERCLGYLPVAARDGGPWHRLRLLLRRRRGAALATVVAVVSLAVGTVGLTVGMVRAQREAAATRAALEESEELVQFLTELFQESDPGQAQGDELTARELFDQGAERLRDRLRDQPMARARLLRTIGDIYAKLGYDGPAEALLVESLDLYRQHAGDDLPQIARAISGLAVMKTKAGELESARDLYLEALGVLERATGTAEPGQRELLLYHLGVLAFRQKDLESAEAYFDQACGTPRLDEQTTDLAARCLEAYGALRVEQDRFDEAEPLYLRSLELRETALGADHPHVASSLESLCLLESDRGDEAAAAEYCERSLDIRQRTLGPAHRVTRASAMRLAIRYRAVGRTKEAEASLLEAVEAWHNDGEAASADQAVIIWIRLGWLAWVGGDLDVAESRYRRALEVADEHGLGGSSSARIALLGTGLVAWKLGRLDDAERTLRALHEENLERDSGSSSTAWTAWGLAGVYRDRAASSRELDEAGTLYEQALEIRRRLHPPGNEFREVVEADYRRYLELREGEPWEDEG